MKTLCKTFIVLSALAGQLVYAQLPSPQPGGRGQAPPPPPSAPAPPGSAPALPEEPATPSQLVNIRVDVTVVEEGGEETVSRKEASVIVADRRSGFVRSAALTTQQDRRFEAQLFVDARPWLERDGRIRTLVTMKYISPPHFSNFGDLKVEPLLETGKPLIVSQASSAISSRRIRVEVTATILK